MTRSPTLIAGVDGCPAGWLVVIRPLDDPARATARIIKTFAEILTLDPAPAVIAIDMPIGLPDIAGPGGRTCDVAARTVLGARQSSIFAVPARSAVMAQDYRSSCAIALRCSDPPRKVSKQMFNIFAKIREIDALMTPLIQARVKEAHPEVAFAALNGWTPLCEPKKVKSQPHEAGLALRRDLLMAAGYGERLFQTPFKRRDAGPDDLLDAAANSWTAARIACGQARCFPQRAPLDTKGLRCEIWG